MATAVRDRFDGEVPTELDDLVTLPGVGRKTGNVLRSVAYDLPGLPGGHPRRPAVAPAQAHQRDRSGEGRARPQRAGARRGARRVLAAADPARAAGVHRPQAALRGLRPRRHLPLGVPAVSTTPTPAFDVRPIEDDDLDQYFDVRAQSFGVARHANAPSGRRSSRARPSVAGFGAFRSGRLLGALRVIPGGQFVGGRSVPMGGIAAVVVRPEARGTGRRAHAPGRGAGLDARRRASRVSSLHPASTRGVPQRRMGARRAAPGGPPSRPRDLARDPGGRERAGRAARRVRRRRAARRVARRTPRRVHGAVDRSHVLLVAARARRRPGRRVPVRRPRRRRVVGLRRLHPDARRGGRGATRCGSTTSRRSTARPPSRSWRFLGGHSMQVERMTLHLAALPALLYLLDEQDATLDLENRWMHRIVDVPGGDRRPQLPGRARPRAVDVRVDAIPSAPSRSGRCRRPTAPAARRPRRPGRRSSPRHRRARARSPSAARASGCSRPPAASTAPTRRRRSLAPHSGRAPRWLPHPSHARD